MDSTTTPVTVTLFHTNYGQSRMRVQFNGHQKSVPMDYSASDPFQAALVDVLGTSTRVHYDERNHGQSRIIFHVYPNTVREIRPDYTVNTYADGYGRWTARIVFPYGAGKTGEGERLIANARRAAQRAIRAELINRGMSPDYRLSYEVVSNTANGSGALASIVIREA